MRSRIVLVMKLGSSRATYLGTNWVFSPWLKKLSIQTVRFSSFVSPKTRVNNFAPLLCPTFSNYYADNHHHKKKSGQISENKKSILSLVVKS